MQNRRNSILKSQFLIPQRTSGQSSQVSSPRMSQKANVVKNNPIRPSYRDSIDPGSCEIDLFLSEKIETGNKSKNFLGVDQNNERKEKKDSGADKHNLLEYLLKVIKELIVIILIIQLVIKYSSPNCNRMERDIRLRFKQNIGEYWQFYPVNNTYIDRFIGLNETTRQILAGIYEDPFYQNQTVPYPSLLNIYSEWNMSQIQSYYLSDYEEYSYSIKRGIDYIQDYKDRPSSVSIQPLTSEVQLWTKQVSCLYYNIRYSETAEVNLTGRVKRTFVQDRTDQVRNSYSYPYYDDLGYNTIYWSTSDDDFLSSTELFEDKVSSAIGPDILDISFTLMFWNPNFKQFLYYNYNITKDNASMVILNNTFNCADFDLNEVFVYAVNIVLLIVLAIDLVHWLWKQFVIIWAIFLDRDSLKNCLCYCCHKCKKKEKNSLIEIKNQEVNEDELITPEAQYPNNSGSTNLLKKALLTNIGNRGLDDKSNKTMVNDNNFHGQDTMSPQKPRINPNSRNFGQVLNFSEVYEEQDENSNNLDKECHAKNIEIPMTRTTAKKHMSYGVPKDLYNLSSSILANSDAEQLEELISQKVAESPKIRRSYFLRQITENELYPGLAINFDKSMNMLNLIKNEEVKTLLQSKGLIRQNQDIPQFSLDNFHPLSDENNDEGYKFKFKLTGAWDKVNTDDVSTPVKNEQKPCGRLIQTQNHEGDLNIKSKPSKDSDIRIISDVYKKIYKKYKIEKINSIKKFQFYVFVLLLHKNFVEVEFIIGVVFNIAVIWLQKMLQSLDNSSRYFSASGIVNTNYYYEQSNNVTFKDEFYNHSYNITLTWVHFKYIYVVLLLCSSIRLVNALSKNLKLIGIFGAKLFYETVYYVRSNGILQFMLAFYIFQQALCIHMAYGELIDLLHHDFMTVQQYCTLVWVGDQTLYNIFKISGYTSMALLLAFLNYTIITQTVLNLLRASVVYNFYEDKDTKLAKPENIFVYPIRWTRIPTKMCAKLRVRIEYIFFRKKYDLRMFSKDYKKKIYEEKRKCYSNWKFDISILHESYKHYYYYIKYDRISWKNNQQTKKSKIMKNMIYSIFMIIFIIVQISMLYSMMPIVRKNVIDESVDKFVLSLNYSNITQMTEYDIRRYFVDVMPYFMMTEPHIGSKPKDYAFPNKISVNTQQLPISSQFIFTAKYREIEKSEEDQQQYKYFINETFQYNSDENYDITQTDTLRDQNYTIYQLESIIDNTAPPIGNCTVTSQNVSYYWDNTANIYVASIPSDPLFTSDFVCCMEKQVLDNFINKYLHTVTIEYMVQSENPHLSYGHAFIKLFRDGGDSFHLEYHLTFLGSVTKGIFAAIMIGQVILSIFVSVMTYQNIRKIQKIIFIYKIWYKIEILPRFNDFMMKIRHKKCPEWQRILKQLPISSFLRMFIGAIQVIIYGIETIRVYLSASNFLDNITLNEKADAYQQYMLLTFYKENQANIERVSIFIYLTLIFCLFELFDSLTVFEKLKMIDKVICGGISIFLHKCFIPLQIFFLWHNLFLYILDSGTINGGYDFYFFNIGRSANWLTRICYSGTQISDSDHMYNIINIFSIILIIIPMRYVFMALVYARFQLLIEKISKHEQNLTYFNIKDIVDVNKYYWKEFINYLKYVFDSFSFKSNYYTKGRSDMILWQKRFNQVLPDIQDSTSLTTYLKAEGESPLSKQSDHEIEEIVQKLEKQVMTYYDMTKTQSYFFTKLMVDDDLFFSHLMPQQNSSNIDVQQKKESQQNVYYKIIDNIIEGGSELHKCTSLELAKLEVIKRDRKYLRAEKKSMNRLLKDIEELEIMNAFFEKMAGCHNHLMGLTQEQEDDDSTQMLHRYDDFIIRDSILDETIETSMREIKCNPENMLHRFDSDRDGVTKNSSFGEMISHLLIKKTLDDSSQSKSNVNTLKKTSFFNNNKILGDKISSDKSMKSNDEEKPVKDNDEDVQESVLRNNDEEKPVKDIGEISDSIESKSD